MIIYLDTSVLVSAFTDEIATERSRRLIQNAAGHRKLISWWVEAEFAAAISAKMRSSVDREKLVRTNLQEFQLFAAESLETVSVEHQHYQLATDLAFRAAGLRAGDALHLAIASSHDATVLTLDLGMAKAARDLGLPVETL